MDLGDRDRARDVSTGLDRAGRADHRLTLTEADAIDAGAGPASASAADVRWRTDGAPAIQEHGVINCPPQGPR